MLNYLTDFVVTFLLIFLGVYFAFAYFGAVMFYGFIMMAKVSLIIAIVYTVSKTVINAFKARKSRQ